ncbi:MAG TPA: hypothetical protein VFA59_09860 [Vicinamibacterales bacterium]|nr:hypothetical protein [Vicinamibacterales bacterium]
MRPMTYVRWAVAALAVASMAMTITSAQIALPAQPHARFGDSVTPAFEGWFDRQDGQHNLLFGYYNRNSAQEFDIPIGPNNNIQPGGPDRGQPTHFLTGRQWGVFVVTLPKDFPATEHVTWSLTANGQQLQIPANLKPEYNIDPFEEAAVHNSPPSIRFDAHGTTVQGPLATPFDRTGSIGHPLALSVWATDDDKYTSGSNAPRAKLGDPVRLTWAKYRGPGDVIFASGHPKFQITSGGTTLDDPVSGTASTTATFKTPGEYWLELVANDYSGTGGAASGGAACCWTTAIVKVNITP